MPADIGGCSAGVRHSLHFRAVTLVYVDGDLLPEAEARISPLDHGFVTGDGVFETILVTEGRPFGLRRHLDRLERSAAGLGIGAPDRAVVEGAVAAVVGSSEPSGQARLRVTVTAGRVPLGGLRGATPTSLVVALAPITAGPRNHAVAVVPWPRNERGALAGLKTTSYAENVLAIEWSAERGAGEAIFANTQGNLCEGAGSNVFVVVDGALLTPPLSSGLLAGVTRDLVLELVECVEKDVPVGRFAAGDVEEAFLTSTTRGVQHVSMVDGHELPASPGPRTSEAAAALSDLMASTDEP